MVGHVGFGRGEEGLEELEWEWGDCTRHSHMRTEDGACGGQGKGGEREQRDLY